MSQNNNHNRLESVVLALNGKSYSLMIEWFEEEEDGSVYIISVNGIDSCAFDGIFLDDIVDQMRANWRQEAAESIASDRVFFREMEAFCAY